MCRGRKKFEVGTGLSQEYVMSPLLFNAFIYAIMRERKARIINIDVCENDRDGRQCRMSSLLFADEAEPIADSEECS